MTSIYEVEIMSNVFHLFCMFLIWYNKSMKKLLNYSVPFLLTVLIITLGAGASLRKNKIETADAQAASGSLSGYEWSDNIGWVSFSDTNTNVTMDATTGALTGYAWADNIGWVKFGGLSGFPSGSGTVSANAVVNTAAGTVSGWARACAGTIKSGDSTTLPTQPGDCSTMTSRSDGWDGWISLSGTNYGATYNSTTGAFGGYAWGSDVVGWVSFALLNATGNNTSNMSCTLTPTPSLASPLPAGGGSVTFNWSSTNTTSCNLAGGAFSASGGSAGSATWNVTQNTNFILSCANATHPTPQTCASQTAVVTGSTASNPGTKSMWLNNDVNKLLTNVTIHSNRTVPVNWNVANITALGYACRERQVSGPTLAQWSSTNGIIPDQSVNNSPQVTLSGLSVGTYILDVSCTDPNSVMTATSTNRVSITVVPGSIQEQ
jgi:hypothetical protein